MGEGWGEVPCPERGRGRPRTQAVRVLAEDHNISVGKEGLQGLGYLRIPGWVGPGPGASGKQTSF